MPSVAALVVFVIAALIGLVLGVRRIVKAGQEQERTGPPTSFRRIYVQGVVLQWLRRRPASRRRGERVAGTVYVGLGPTAAVAGHSAPRPRT